MWDVILAGAGIMGSGCTQAAAGVLSFARSRETVFWPANRSSGLSVLGGKLTACRAIVERALARLILLLPTRVAVADTRSLRLDG